MALPHRTAQAPCRRHSRRSRCSRPPPLTASAQAPAAKPAAAPAAAAPPLRPLPRPSRPARSRCAALRRRPSRPARRSLRRPRRRPSRPALRAPAAAAPAAKPAAAPAPAAARRQARALPRRRLPAAPRPPPAAAAPRRCAEAVEGARGVHEAVRGLLEVRHQVLRRRDGPGLARGDGQVDREVQEGDGRDVLSRRLRDRRSRRASTCR